MAKHFSKRLAALALSSLLLLGLTACGGGGAEEIRFGTGDDTGTYYSYGMSFTELTELPRQEFKVKTTSGSAANIRLLGEGFLQLAFAQNDTLNDAMTKSGSFAQQESAIGDPIEYGAIAALYTESCQIVVPAGSDIVSVADLRGKTVSVGEEESGVLQNADQILLAHGLTRGMLTPKYLSFSAAAKAMANGEVDAIFITAGAPTNAIAALAREMDVRLLSINSNISDILLDTYGFYTLCTIPAGTYAGQEEDVETVGVKSVLVASETLSDDTVEALTASLFDHAAELQSSAPGAEQLNLEYAVEGLSIPLHPGAANYYTAQGMDVSGVGTNGNEGGNAQ